MRSAGKIPKACVSFCKVWPRGTDSPLSILCMVLMLKTLVWSPRSDLMPKTLVWFPPYVFVEDCIGFSDVLSVLVGDIMTQKINDSEVNQY